MNQRSVTIKGAPKEISVAVAKIFETLEDLSYQVDNIDKKAVR